jgi:hypothetical protein
MLSRSMREALEAKTIADKLVPQRPQSDTTRVPIGEQRCPQCGWPCDKLQYDEQGNPTGALYEHRSHEASGARHQWPQPHSCGPALPDDCPFCKPCVDC